MLGLRRVLRPLSLRRVSMPSPATSRRSNFSTVHHDEPRAGMIGKGAIVLGLVAVGAPTAAIAYDFATEKADASWKHSVQNRRGNQRHPSFESVRNMAHPELVKILDNLEMLWHDRRMASFGPIFMTNLAVFLGWRFATTSALNRVMHKYFLLNPVPSQFVPSSMLLSSFSHTGAIHFGFNMFALWSFCADFQAVVRPPHFQAVYCTAGAFSGFTSLLASAATRSRIPSLGASGAVLFLAAWTAWKNPQTKYAFIFLPNVEFEGTSMIKGLMTFDLLGLVFRLRFFDHAAHLGGTSLGWLCSHLNRADEFAKLNPIFAYSAYCHWLRRPGGLFPLPPPKQR